MAETPALRAIHDRLETLAARIGAPLDLLPERTEYGREGSLWVEQRGNPPVFELTYFEGGATHFILETADPETVIRQVMDGVTFTLAMREAQARGRPEGDARLVLFEIQQRLMDQLDPDWGAALRAHHARVLAEQPAVIL